MSESSQVNSTILNPPLTQNFKEWRIRIFQAEQKFYGVNAEHNENDDKKKSTKGKDRRSRLFTPCLDLNRLLGTNVHVKFYGGREISGILTGFDPLMNLVLDNAVEYLYLRDMDDRRRITDKTRSLGQVICRGTTVVVICPHDGIEAIDNPFTAHGEEE